MVGGGLAVRWGHPEDVQLVGDDIWRHLLAVATPASEYRGTNVDFHLENTGRRRCSNDELNLSTISR